MNDWRDPFESEDSAARQREQRRREREAKRAAQGRETRKSLGERASAAGGARSDPASAAEPAPAPQEPAEPRRPERPRRPETPPVEEREARQAGVPIGSRRPQPGSRADRARSTGEFIARVGASPDASSSEVMRRRLLAVGAIVGFVLVVAVLFKIGGGEEAPPPAPAAVEPIKTFDLTIPEGLTREQIADLVKKETNLKGDYLKETENAPKGFDLAAYDAKDAPNLEGFLFPATYNLERKGRVKDLVAAQLTAFEDNFSQLSVKKAEKKNLTPYDIVNIASMIEKEIALPEERKLASAVIYNRLSDGEPLGIDATLRYELDKFDGQLLESELAADTPYNTRINGGLPPTPIGNPGLASLEAAAAPASSDVRYYVIKPGTCNEHVFTADAAEFEQAVAAYQAALAEEGGSPTEC